MFSNNISINYIDWNILAHAWAWVTARMSSLTTIFDKSKDLSTSTYVPLQQSYIDLKPIDVLFKS